MSGQTQTKFGALPLHDAVLKELRLDWSAGICVAELVAFTDGLQKPARAAKLIWKKTQEVIAPHRAPWGGSVHINHAREEDGWFVLEMQSGDVIRVAAESFEFS
jgi:hypothetical protein